MFYESVLYSEGFSEVKSTVVHHALRDQRELLSPIRYFTFASAPAAHLASNMSAFDNISDHAEHSLAIKKGRTLSRPSLLTDTERYDALI